MYWDYRCQDRKCDAPECRTEPGSAEAGVQAGGPGASSPGVNEGHWAAVASWGVYCEKQNKTKRNIYLCFMRTLRSLGCPDVTWTPHQRKTKACKACALTQKRRSSSGWTEAALLGGGCPGRGCWMEREACRVKEYCRPPLTQHSEEGAENSL